MSGLEKLAARLASEASHNRPSALTPAETRQVILALQIRIANTKA